MSQQTKGNFPQEIFAFKKAKNGSTQMKLGKGVKILVNDQEVDAGEHGNLFLVKIEDEISRFNELVEQGKMKQESADKQIAYLQKKQEEWGFSSIVKAKLK